MFFNEKKEKNKNIVNTPLLRMSLMLDDIQCVWSIIDEVQEETITRMILTSLKTTLIVHH